MTEMNLVNMYRCGLLPLLLAAAASCSDMNPAQDTYDTVYGALEGGSGGTAGDGPIGNAGSGGTGTPSMPEVPEAWACLSNPTQRAAIMPQPTRITYRVPIVDFDSQPTVPTIVENLSISFCVDAACMSFTGPDVITVSNPDPSRPFVYDFSIPYGLSNLTVKLEAMGYAPMYYILGGPMVGTPSGGTTVAGQAIAMLKTTARDELYAGLGLDTPASAVRGDLAVRTLNCVRDPMTGQTTPLTRAAEVSLGASPEDTEAVPYSLTYGNRAIADRPTDDRGVAGFASLRPQNYSVWGIAPVGEGMEFGDTVVPVRAGSITLLEVRDGLGDRGWGQ